MTTIKQHGIVVEYRGKFWGTTFYDAEYTIREWTTIDKADMGDPEFCKSPQSFTYHGSPESKELAKGRLVRVTKTTTFEVEG